MAEPSATPLPDGYRAPLTLLDDNHHGAYVHICNALGLSIVLSTLAIRVFIRTKVSPPFSSDDWTLAAATALAAVQSSLTFAEVHRGFGTSIDLLTTSALVDVQKLAYVADIFYILAIYVGKCSVTLLFKRICADRMHKLVAWGVLGACSISGFISIFLVTIRCDVSQPWLQYDMKCSSLLAQWSAVAALDIITEIAVFAISILLVWGLQTKAANKFRVVLAFSIRLPVIAVIIIRVIYIQQEIVSTNPTLEGAIAAVLTQIEIFFGIMAATIPCLRPFLAEFVTHYGAMSGDTVMGGSQIGTGSKKDPSGSRSDSNYGLSSLSRTSMPRDDNAFRTDGAGNETTITRGSERSRGHFGSMGSNDSNRRFITKEVQFSVGSQWGGEPSPVRATASHSDQPSPL